MQYILPISYQGNGRSLIESQEKADSDKNTLTKLVEGFDGTINFADSLNPRASFRNKSDAIAFRTILVQRNKKDLPEKLHYHQLYPMETVPSA